MIDLLVVSHATFKGVNRYVFDLLRKQHNLKVEIIAPKQLKVGGKWTLADPPEDAAQTMHYLELKGNNPRTHDFDGLFDLLESRKPKGIYLDNDPVSMQALRLGKWARKNGSRLICLSCENLSFYPLASYKRLGGIKGFVNGCIKTGLMYMTKPYVDHVFTINDAGTLIFKNCGYKSVSKTPLGFNPEVFKPDMAARTDIRSKLELGGTYTIAYIGRMVPEKGVDLLLYALHKLRSLNWNLLLDEFDSQHDPYHKYLSDLIETLELKERVRYFNANHVEVARYMNAADLIVMPSISTPRWVEQYGRVAPESMGCGKLVLASKTGALPELIGDAGIYFEEGNVQDLTDKLETIIKHPDQFDEIKEKAMRRAVNHLSIQNQANQLYQYIS